MKITVNMENFDCEDWDDLQEIDIVINHRKYYKMMKFIYSLLIEITEGKMPPPLSEDCYSISEETKLIFKDLLNYLENFSFEKDLYRKLRNHKIEENDE